MKAMLLAPGVLFFGSIVAAQPSRVLVIHNTNPLYATDSLNVAQHYQTRRPGANLCGIPFPSNVSITQAQWTSSIRGLVRNCLDAAGRTNVLYIVMSHQTPFILERPSPAAAGALDSYVADVWDSYSTTYFSTVPNGSHRYYMQPQTAGNVYGSFQTLADYRLQPRSNLIYSVWRLDGATPAVARGLVDKAVDTENAGGLLAGGGTVYVDNTYASLTSNADTEYASAEFDLDRMAVMTNQAGLSLVQDKNPAEIGFSPAPLSAPNAILYSGWYSLYNYNNVFNWKPGAVGWHLDSSSLTHPRSGSSWSARAVQEGITVTSGALLEPYLEGLAHPDVVVRHLYQGGNVGDAFLRGTPWLKWMIINMGDPLYRPFPSGVAPFNNLNLAEPSLRVSPGAVVNGSIDIQITLKDPAPVGGQVVNWSNNWTPYYVSSLPTSTVIPQGQRTGNVSLTVTNPVPDGYRGVVIHATYGSTTLQNSAAVVTLLGGISKAVQSVTAGTAFDAAVTLNLRAPAGGTVVNLSSSHPAILQVPASVTVPFGSQTGLFRVMTTVGSVASPVLVTITASTATSQTTTTVSVQP